MAQQPDQQLQVACLDRRNARIARTDDAAIVRLQQRWEDAALKRRQRCFQVDSTPLDRWGSAGLSKFRAGITSSIPGPCPRFSHDMAIEVAVIC